MSKSDRLKARTPRGFADRGASDLAATNRILAAIRGVYELYGFEGLETPAVEYTEALGKFLPDQDRPNEGVFSFQDDDEAWLSLRYDLTAPLARHVAERLDAQSLTLPYRGYRSGWVFRNEKPGPGRFRQFMQFDADTVGSASPAADAEMCMMMADVLEAVGVRRGDYVIKVNSRKVLDGVMEAIGLGGDEHAGRRLTVLRALDKYDRLGLTAVKMLLGSGREDDSGDRTEGARLQSSQVDLIASIFGAGAVLTSDATAAEAQHRPRDVVTFSSESGEWRRKVTFDSVFETLDLLRGKLAIVPPIFDDGIAELKVIANIVGSYDDGRIQIDPSVVRGLEYYTGPVFEAELTVPMVDEDGRTVRFGSVGGGGRYDGLVGRFRAEPVPATGFSIGVSRLMDALRLIKSPIVTGEAATGPVVVLVLDRDRMADYQRMVAELRHASVPAELYLGSAGMKAQMKYADRRRAPCVVIQGSQERERGEVQIKDLDAGEEAAAGAGQASNAEYRAARLAQISAPRAKLVDEVRAILDRRRQRS